MPRKNFKVREVMDPLAIGKTMERAEQALINAAGWYMRAGQPVMARSALELARDSVNLRIEMVQAVLSASPSSPQESAPQEAGKG